MIATEKTASIIIANMVVGDGQERPFSLRFAFETMQGGVLNIHKHCSPEELSWVISRLESVTGALFGEQVGRTVTLVFEAGEVIKIQHLCKPHVFLEI